MKYSNRRECIYERVKNAFDHPTADMVYEDVKKDIPHISLGTVYRNLNQLVDNGYIRKLTHIDGIVHFDKNDAHEHMKCIKCNTIIDLDLAFHLDSYVEEKSGNEILSHELLFIGICKQCRKKEQV